MNEQAYSQVRGEEFGHFTFSTKRSRDAFVRRCEEYDAEYHVIDHHVDGEWDTATIKVAADDLRPLRYLIST